MLFPLVQFRGCERLVLFFIFLRTGSTTWTEPSCDPQCSRVVTVSVVATVWPVAPGCGRLALGTAPTPQSCDGVGKLRGRIRDLGGRQMHRHRSLPATLPRARAGSRLQPTSAAALADQPHYPDSSRVVCHSRSDPVRTGSPPSHQDHRCRGRNPGVLALNGAWNAALRCAPGAARSLLSEATILAGLCTWQLKQQNKSERVISDRLPATLSAQQPFHSSLSVSGSQACHGEEKGAGRQMQFVAGTQISLPSMAADGLSDPPRNPARTHSSATAHTRGSFTVTHAFRGIFCADQAGSACEELQKQHARSSRFENSLLVLRAARANVSIPGSVPRRVGPCRPVLLDEFSWQADPVPLSGSLGRADSSLFRTYRQYLRLRFGSLEIASGSGRRTVAKQRISQVSPFVSLVCALCGAPGKESIQPRAKHQKSDQSSTRVTSNIVDQLPKRSYQARECQPNLGESTLENGAAARACSKRPPSGHPKRPSATKSSRPLRSSPIPARPRPLVGMGRLLPNTSSRQRSRLCGAPIRDRRRHHHSAEYQAQSCECSEKQTATHVTSLPCHHIITPLHAPNHLNWSVLPQHNFLQNSSVCFLSSATWQHLGASALMAGHRRCAFARMRPAEQPRICALKHNEKTSRSGNGSSQRSRRSAVHQLSQQARTTNAQTRKSGATRRRATQQGSQQAQTTAIQSFQGAQCCSKELPNWQPWQPVPWQCKLRTHSVGRSPCGAGSRPRQSLPQPPKRWIVRCTNGSTIFSTPSTSSGTLGDRRALTPRQRCWNR